MIVDSHCHLDYPDLYDNLEKVITRAKDNEIKYLLTICTTLESFQKAFQQLIRGWASCDSDVSCPVPGYGVEVDARLIADGHCVG